MKTLIILIILFITEVGDKMNEETKLLPGQKWEKVIGADNPFKNPDTVRVTILKIKNGYVQYSHELVGYHKDLIDSDEVSYFKESYKGSKLIEKNQ